LLILAMIAQRSFVLSTTLAFLCFFLFAAPLANVLFEKPAEGGVVVTSLNIEPHIQMVYRHHCFTAFAARSTPKAFANFSCSNAEGVR
jgi:hypothetical protein